MEDMALVMKRRKKEREAWWRKILAYYMMQKIVEEQKRAELLEAYAKHDVFVITEHIVQREGIIGLLFRKEPGRLSAFEILEKIAAGEELESPFRHLLSRIRKAQASAEETEKAIAEVIEKAPPIMLEDARQERERREAWEQKENEERQAAVAAAQPRMAKQDEEAIRFDEQLRYKMAFLKKIMPQALFVKLCQGLAREGHDVNVNELDLPDRPMNQMTYETYVAQKQAILRMHNGVFVNADNVYTSAAYMLAAYEQKDAPQFNAGLADERARELFGSKAFRVYLDSHPGSLVAASQNSFMDMTHEGIVRLEEEFKERDKTLGIVSRNLRKAASGQPAGYHKMLNRLERYVNSPSEPGAEEKNGLISSLGEYILKDCAAGSQAADENGLKNALYAIKALVPADSFKKGLEKVNKGRSHPLTERDFADPVEEAQPDQAERELQLQLGQADWPN